MKSDIIVIGAGASGMMAAICAARQKASVIVLERMPRVGKKLLATGNGRCNYTNRHMQENCFHSQSPECIQKMLDAFGNKDTEAFFLKLGILPKAKDGYVYPNSMQAASVVDALRFEMERLGIQVLTEVEVTGILPKGKGFQIQSKDRIFHCRRVILAAGGKASEKLGSNGSGYRIANALGYSMVSEVPALTGLKAKEKVFKALGGIRTEGKVTLYIDNKYIDAHVGELQLTEYGISGIPVFQLSGQAAYGLKNHQKVRCELDFFPEWQVTDLQNYLYERKRQFKGASIEVFETGLLNRKLIHECLRMVEGMDMSKLAQLLKHFPATITESRGYAFAQVCAGGVDLKEIHPESCETLQHPGLYIVGELLDADGICGGYNLQWAWTTGYLAGQHAGKECHASHRTN